MRNKGSVRSEITVDTEIYSQCKKKEKANSSYGDVINKQNQPHG